MQRRGSELAQRDPKALQVLIVEDDEASREALIWAVESRGNAACSAVSLASGRAALAETIPDVLLLDLTLPDGDGVELLSEIDTAACAVVFVTGHDDPYTLEDAKRRGAHACLVKPIELQSLWDILEELRAQRDNR